MKPNRALQNSEGRQGSQQGKATRQKVKKKEQPKGQYGGSKPTSNVTSGQKAKKPSQLKPLGQVESEVIKYIVGQDQQVRQIITAIYRSLEFRSIKSNLLIIGKSGTGKTETIKQIASRLNLPYTIEDATKYTQEGYYGADVTDMVYNLIENAKKDYARAEHGIIIVDEIDKKVGHEEHDVAGVEVLKSLLKIIEGTKIKIPKEPETEEDFFKDEYIDFDTRNLIIIFLGAFSGIEKIKNKRLNRGTIGFGNGKDICLSKKQQETLKQDLIAYGMPEEFVGRVDTIVEMNPLGENELVKILSNSKLSIFKRYQTELLRKGVKLVYDEDLFKLIAKASLTLDTGARELSNTVNHMFEQIVYEVLANPKRYHQCVLSPDIVQDNTKFTLS